MSLKLYFHPLSSYCQKVLIALYENATPFAPELVDLSDQMSRATFLKVWPIGKFPVLRDEARGRTVPESSTIIEYLAQHYPGQTRLIPDDADLAWEVRRHDRLYDLHVHEPMQRIVGDRLRPAGRKDPQGVEEAKARLQVSYGIIEADMQGKTSQGKTWATGADFTMADCAAAPALFYANLVLPFGQTHRTIAAYLDRLMKRPSFARAVAEAKPYFHMFPKEP
jgi:glutathione S-transferase